MRKIFERGGRRKIIEVLKKTTILVGLQTRDREASQIKHWKSKGTYADYTFSYSII